MSRMQLLKAVRAVEHLCRYLPAIGCFRPLRGGFSALKLLDESRLPGNVLCRAQEMGPCLPDSMTARAGMRQHDHQPWPIFWVRSDTARLVGNAHYWRDENDRRCSESVFHHQQRRNLSDDSLFAQIFIGSPKRLPGAWTSISSSWCIGRNYYHWMLDSLPRLSVREALPEPTRILLPRSSAAFMGETLEMLGLSDMVEQTDANCVQPERYYFCSPLAMTGVYNPIGYDWLRKKFAQFLNSNLSGNPVFFTRRGGARVPVNIDEIEGLFIHQGFSVVDCGKITVKEQMRLASMAPMIAGLHGAAMTNLLWAKPGTPVLEIFEPGYLNACYEQIAMQGGLKYHFEIIYNHTELHYLANWCDQA